MPFKKSLAQLDAVPGIQGFKTSVLKPFLWAEARLRFGSNWPMTNATRRWRLSWAKRVGFKPP
jgi:hypothetical protein